MEHIKIFCYRLWRGVSDHSHLSAIVVSSVILLGAITFWLLSGTSNAIAADTSPDSVPSNSIERVDIDCPTYDFYKYSGKDTLSNKIDEIIFYDKKDCLIKSRSEIRHTIYKIIGDRVFKTLEEAEEFLPMLYASEKYENIKVNNNFKPCSMDKGDLYCQSNLIIGYCVKGMPASFSSEYCTLDQRVFRFYFLRKNDGGFYIDKILSWLKDKDLSSRYSSLRGAPNGP